ncbi:MAG: hypothetical protein P8186_17550 [Anaerolineae bacterium]|jgi:hypothetical protein
MSPPRTKTKAKATSQPDSPFAEQCQEALTSLERVLEILPQWRFQEVDMAERAIVRLRDSLIDRMRGESAPAETGRLRAALDRVNVALSLVTGIEYPAAGIQEVPLKQARDVLKDLLAEGLP